MQYEKVQAIRPPLLRIADARAQLSIGNTKFYELVKKGLIEIVKIGSATRVKTDSLDRFIASLPSNGSDRQGAA